MVDGVNSNMPIGGKPAGEGVPTAKNATGNEASIFSSYDDNKDGKLSYNDDASARSYLDAGKSDMVRFDATYNEDPRIKAALDKLDNLWKNAIGDINIAYSREGTQEEIDDKAMMDMFKESFKRERVIQSQLDEVHAEIENIKKEIDAENAQKAEEVPEVEPEVEEEVQQEEPTPKVRKKSTKKAQAKKKAPAKKATKTKTKTTNLTTTRSREYVDITAKQDATQMPAPKQRDLTYGQPTLTAMRIMATQEYNRNRRR